MNPLKSVSEYIPDIDNLPLVFAGPVLRRTEPDSVTVWLALKAERSLCLKIYDTKDRGKTIGETLFQGQRHTVPLGRHLHIVAITAKSNGDVLLQPGQIYAYNISTTGDRQNLIDNEINSPHGLSYFPHGFPTFTLPPDNLNHLKIVHGSCRKPHGGGKDTLSYLDNLIQVSADSATERPHQVFLTGDQIYGDDVANPILWLTQGINQLLFGWSEELSLIAGTISAQDLHPGTRTTIAEVEGGLTSMLKNSPEEAKSHLFSFGEYAAAYLLAWSPVFIPARFPKGTSLFKNRQKSRLWDKELNDINSFTQDLGRVRKALANVPRIC